MEVGTITAVIAGLLSVIALLLIVIRWVMDSKKPINGNGKELLKITDVQEALTAAVQGFRESHLENKMRQQEMITTLGRIESHLMICADILKALPKRNTD